MARSDIETLSTTTDGSAWGAAGRGAFLSLLTAHDAATTITIVSKTGSYTFALGDETPGKVFEFTTNAAKTATIPGNSIVPFAVGTVLELYNVGTGLLTLAPATNVILEAPAGQPLTVPQYGSVALRKRATQTWAVAGYLSA